MLQVCVCLPVCKTRPKLDTEPTSETWERQGWRIVEQMPAASFRAFIYSRKASLDQPWAPGTASQCRGVPSPGFWLGCEASLCAAQGSVGKGITNQLRSRRICTCTLPPCSLPPNRRGKKLWDFFLTVRWSFTSKQEWWNAVLYSFGLSGKDCLPRECSQCQQESVLRGGWGERLLQKTNVINLYGKKNYLQHWGEGGTDGEPCSWQNCRY